MPGGRIVAVIDVGSNSVRLLVARELSPFAFEVVDEERYDARLGQDQLDGEISEAGFERGLRALRIVTQVAEAQSPSSLVTVGTEALRRASNADAFLRQAREQTGVDVKVLTAEEEAFASFLGAANSTGLRNAYLLDIGGGSLEFMTVNERKLVDAQSAPLGAIYATERYLKADPPTGKEVRALRKAVRQQIGAREPLPALYGVGGAIRNLARIVRLRRSYPLRRLHGLILTRREISRLTRLLATTPADGRRRIPGVSANRADILLAAAIVVDEVMEITGSPGLLVSGQGLREGLVWQELRGAGAVLPDVRAASIAGLALANGIDQLAAEPVVMAAAMLFTGTESVHGLGPPELDLLLNAARLAGIGMHVDYYNRDRHAEYLVHSGDLHGFSHREIVLLGALVRWAESGTPDLSPYASIVEPGDDRLAATLAAMLGAAQAVQRRMPSPVDAFEGEAGEGAVVLRLRCNSPPDAEVYALEQQQKRLESALRTPIVIEVS